MDYQTEAIKKLRDVVMNEGSHPEYHRRIRNRHVQEWPILWDAIYELITMVEKK